MTISTPDIARRRLPAASRFVLASFALATHRTANEHRVVSMYSIADDDNVHSIAHAPSQRRSGEAEVQCVACACGIRSSTPSSR